MASRLDIKQKTFRSIQLSEFIRFLNRKSDVRQVEQVIQSRTGMDEDFARIFL